jgi:adenylosuccinate lyase
MVPTNGAFITNRVTILAANDEEAKERAKQLVDGHAVELWQAGRKIATFDHPE